MSNIQKLIIKNYSTFLMLVISLAIAIMSNNDFFIHLLHPFLLYQLGSAAL